MLVRNKAQVRANDDLQPVGEEDPERALALKKHELGITKSQDAVWTKKDPGEWTGPHGTAVFSIGNGRWSARGPGLYEGYAFRNIQEAKKYAEEKVKAGDVVKKIYVGSSASPKLVDKHYFSKEYDADRLARTKADAAAKGYRVVEREGFVTKRGSKPGLNQKGIILSVYNDGISKCARCNGSGKARVEGKQTTCPDCGGKGSLGGSVNDLMPVGDDKWFHTFPANEKDKAQAYAERTGQRVVKLPNGRWQIVSGKAKDAELPVPIKPVGLVPGPSGENNEETYMPRKVASDEEGEKRACGYCGQEVKTGGGAFDESWEWAPPVTGRGMATKVAWPGEPAERDHILILRRMMAGGTTTWRSGAPVQKDLDKAEAAYTAKLRKYKAGVTRSRDKEKGTGIAMGDRARALDSYQAAASGFRKLTSFANDTAYTVIMEGGEKKSVEGKSPKDALDQAKYQYGSKVIRVEKATAKDVAEPWSLIGKAKDKMKATDFSLVAPAVHLKNAVLREIQGDRARALDAYRAAATGFRQSGDRVNEDKARDGIKHCQSVGYDAQYTHPGAGKVRVCDSASTALRTALERTRAGESVRVIGVKVMPAKAHDTAMAMGVLHDKSAKELENMVKDPGINSGVKRIAQKELEKRAVAGRDNAGLRAEIFQIQKRIAQLEAEGTSRSKLLLTDAKRLLTTKMKELNSAKDKELLPV